MATAKKTMKDVKKTAVKTSSIKKTATVDPKKAVSSPKQEKVSSKTNVAAKHVKKVAQKLSPREAKIQQIRLKLLHQRETLLSEAEVALLNELPGQTMFPDLGDQASAETDRNFMLRLRGREQRLLKKIDQALERVDTGTFGICEDCGSEINLKRLEARPVTTMCIDCKTLQEEEEKLRES
jgi:DnaK suppressor protein